MIENLKLAGLNEELIEAMIENLGYDLVLNLACNYDKISSNINILKKYEIVNIDELLLYKPELFLNDSVHLLYLLMKKNISNLSELVKNDYNCIDMIFE